MSNALVILTAPALLTAWVVHGRSRAALQSTTLLAAWWMGLVVLLLWSIASVVTILPHTAKTALRSDLWYAVAVAALCPPVAVLGARRPVCNVWPYFVVLPLVGVFSVPALTSLWRHGVATPLRLELPTFVGLGLVLVMGLGNYLFTRWAPAVLLAGISLVLILCPLGPFGLTSPETAERFWNLATLGLGLSFAAAAITGRFRRATQTGVLRLWSDFHDLFGIVWASRVRDRVNRTAREENWPLRLQLRDIRWTGEQPHPEERRAALARLEETLRWLLKRFVDAGWIERRIAGR